jgi:hypothetical protein
MRNQMILWFMKKQTKGNLKEELKMKNIILLLMAGLIVSCTTTQKSASDPLPQTKTSNFVVTDFRNIAQENVEDYLKVEKFWKAVHQERIKDGRMTAWLLLKVVNDEKKDIPYNYITLNVYPDMEKVSNGGPTEEDFVNAHGDQKSEQEIQAMGVLTQKVNNIIRSDLSTTISSIYSLTKYRRANFMKTAPGQRDAFVESRQGFIQPIFSRMIHDINAPMSGWILNELVTPDGAEKEYDFISYDLFKDKADIGRANPNKNYTKLAHPNLSNEEVQVISKKNTGMRKMVKREVWEVVDYAFKGKRINGVWSIEGNAYQSGKLANSVPLKIIRDGNFLVLHMKDGVINHVHTGSTQYDGIKMIEKIRATSETENNSLGKSFTFDVKPTPNTFLQLGKNDKTGADWKEQWKRATKNTFNRTGIEGVWMRQMDDADTIMVKFILDHTWVWFVMNKNTGLITNSLGGTFEYNAPEYIEKSEFHFNSPNSIGGTLQSELTVQGEELSLVGTINRDGEKNQLKETWKRFEW